MAIPTPAQLSNELRKGQSPFLDKRRKLTALTLVSLGSMGVLSLYQMGLVKNVPEPPLPFFSAERVDGSAQGYSILQTPDSVLGIGSYAATLGLIAMGGKDRARQMPWLPIALAGKAVFDAAVAGKLTVDQVVKHKALCIWCVASTAATFAALPYVVPEARAALNAFKSGK
jgi:uncharacterized membrane protein